MSRRLKELLTGDLSRRLEGVEDAVFVEFAGLTADEATALRSSLRETGITFNVVKNTLFRRVLEGRGLNLPEECFRGPTAVVTGEADALTASKAVADWRKKAKKPLPLKGGLLNGEPLGPEQAERLVKMPSVLEIKQMLVSAVAGPLTSMVGVTNNVLAGVPNVLRAIADKKEEEGD